MLSLRWLGHSTVALDVDGVRILTDPLLRRHAGALRRRTPRPRREHWDGTRAVLLSHLHHDHAELASLRMLAGVPVLTAAENAAWLRRRGIDAVALAGRDGDHDRAWTAVGPDVGVRLVRADHHHRPMPHRPNAAHGHLVRSRSARIWVAGDTGLHDEMADLPRLAGGPIDLAVVPVAGWGPRLSGGHLDPAQAARAVAAAGARWALPVHWGTLHPPLVTRFGAAWMERPGEEFAQAVASLAPGTRVVALRPGDSWAAPATALP